MKKYWTIFRVNLQKSLEYRAEIFTHMIMGLFTFAVMVFVFGAIFRQTDSFAGYTFPAIFTYLVMTRFLHPTVRWNTARQVGDEIKEGRLSFYLMKPVSYLKYWFSLFLADRFFDIFVRIFLILLFLTTLPSLFLFPSLASLFWFGLSLSLALCLNFLLNLGLASFAFWVTDIRLFSTAVDLAIGFLAGFLLPLDAFPSIFRQTATFLPFQYLIYFPIKVYQGLVTPPQMIQGFFISFLWIVAIFSILNYFWYRGVRKYEDVGH